MKIEDLDRAVFSSSIGDKIKNLMGVYSLLDEKEAYFSSFFGVKCPSRCGECCLHYLPFLSESEALVAAYLILKENREEEIMGYLKEGDTNLSRCPLYLENKEHHCSFYEGRSMVCRLFSSASSLDKNGLAVYKDCKWKENKVEIESSLLEKERDRIPIMEYFGESLEPEGESIYTSLPKAINKIKLLVSYSDNLPA